MNEANYMSPYSRRDLSCAVKLAALFGWVGVIGVPLFSSEFRNGIDLNSLSLVFWYALFGLPFSLFICWLLVKPFLRIMMRHQVSYFRAIIWGAGIAGNIIAIRLIIRFLISWRLSQNPKSTSSFGDGTGTISVNGVYTDYGWWLFAKSSLKFLIICIVAALVVRMIIGPGNSSPQTEVSQ